MWEGFEDLSDYSVGIELEGYYNVPFSEEQYKSLRRLIRQLEEKYQIDDQRVLEHYRVAYSGPNRYHKSNQRGRKLDPGPGKFRSAKSRIEGNAAERSRCHCRAHSRKPNVNESFWNDISRVRDDIEEDEGSAEVSEEFKVRKLPADRQPGKLPDRNTMLLPRFTNYPMAQLCAEIRLITGPNWFPEQRFNSEWR